MNTKLHYFTIALFLIPLAIACGPLVAEDEKAPNVLLIFVDDLGTRDVGCFGADDLSTPHIDALAEDGVMLTRAYAHKVCCPARAMLLTGRYPQRSTVNNWTQGNMHEEAVGLNMSLSEVTIAEVFKQAGYRTAIFGKWHLGADEEHGPTCQGFDEFFGHRGGFIDNYRHYFLHGRGFHDLYRGTEEVFLPDEYFSDLVVEESLVFLDANADQPFFLYAAFNLPHYPEQADPQFDALYEDMPEPRRSYAKVVSTVDDRIGILLDRIDQLGLTDDTIVVFMSDNGYSTESAQISVDDHTSGLPKGHNYGANGGGGDNGPFRGAKGCFFEGGIRVPAVVRYPGVLPEGVVRDQMTTACDWLPTLAELADIEGPGEDVQLDGRSIVAVLQGDAVSPHEIFHWQWQAGWAVMEGDWKLISDNVNSRYEEDRIFLGRVDGDEPEGRNLAEEEPDRVQRMTQMHEDWVSQVMP
jgi:arylsulfatase A